MGALTDTFVKQVKHSGRAVGDKHADGAGLYLHVKAAGKYWRCTYRHGGKQKTLALGVYPAVTLAQARKAHTEARELLAKAIDPSQHRKVQKLQRTAEQANSFQAVSEQWLAKWSVGKAPTTVSKNTTWLERDVFPAIGVLPIADITTPMLIAIVKAVEKRGALDVAGRILTMCGMVFRFAVAHGHTTQNPAAAIRSSDLLPARRVKNHARISEAELPGLMTAINDYQGHQVTRLAMRLMAHVYVRTSELIEGQWSEVDFEARRWTIPAERMKMSTSHVVPLTPQALAILRELHDLTGGGEWMFPHATQPKRGHMSNNTVLFALYRLGYKGRMTGHGFRGVASTIMHEHGLEHAHIEVQLAHMERNKVSAAYNHARYLPQRTQLMRWWSNYLDNCTRPKVVTLPPRQA